jgi:hypothetical protein
LGDFEVAHLLGKNHKSAVLVVLDKTPLQSSLNNFLRKFAILVKSFVMKVGAYESICGKNHNFL